MEATWGSRHARIDTVEHLDALLDRIDGEARATGRAQDVQLVGEGAAGRLGIVVGHDRSVLNHVPADGNPPYLTSRGKEHRPGVFTFYVAGEHHSESPWRNTVTAAVARNAARVFLLTGRLDERVDWEEV
jgi:immunity protein Imm1 of predicted polymorphic toxin system